MATNTTLALGGSNLPEKTVTIEEFIEMGAADEITYHNFSILAKFVDENSEIQYAITNVIYDYMEDLLSRAVTLELSNDDFTKYKYKPKLLAYDIYNTTELYFVILALNGMCDIKDFTKKKLKMLYYADMQDLLNQIYAAESEHIKYNRKHLDDKNKSTW